MGKAKTQTRAEETRRCTKAMRSFLVAYRGLLEDEFRDADFSLAQLRLLYAVRQKSGVSAAELSRMCEVTPQTAQTLLTRAQREKWIRRAKSATNDRIVTTELTAKGEALLARGEAAAAQIEARLWTGMKLSEIRQMNGYMERCLANAKE
jgi:MarR family transcriptional regulator, organic hydroperoxide resistance regulator